MGYFFFDLSKNTFSIIKINRTFFYSQSFIMNPYVNQSF